MSNIISSSSCQYLWCLKDCVEKLVCKVILKSLRSVWKQKKRWISWCLMNSTWFLHDLDLSVCIKLPVESCRWENPSCTTQRSIIIIRAHMLYGSNELKPSSCTNKLDLGLMLGLRLGLELEPGWGLWIEPESGLKIWLMWEVSFVLRLKKKKENFVFNEMLCQSSCN